MRGTRSVLLTLLPILLSGAAAVRAADYIGAEKCKICHKVEYTSWESLEHAKAFDTLQPAEQAKAECLRCHATAGKAELPGVQCEACHGPGGEYKSMTVMKDRQASLAAGLLLPDEAACKSCHSNAPHDLPEFDYAEAVEIGVHDRKP